MCPSEWASHKSVKGDRGITLAQSKRLFQLTEVLIPVASHEFLVVMSEHSKRKKKNVCACLMEYGSNMVFVILTLGSFFFQWPLHADGKQTTPERDRICFRQCLSTFPARLHSNV